MLSLLTAIVMTIALQAGSTTPPPAAPAPPPPPPAPVAPTVRPPTNALIRENPRVYDLTFSLTLATFIPAADASMRGLISVADAPIVLPFIPRGAYSAVDLSSFSARLFANGRPFAAATRSLRVDANQDLGLSLLVLPVPKTSCQILKSEFTYRTQAWSSRFDERIGARATWPQSWPDECADALKPQAWIESDNPRFATFVQEISQGQLRTVPPLYAAKDLIRAVIQRLRVDGNGIAREGPAVTGMELKGALAAMTDGVGSPHDLTGACVATLRAAGIPARVVIGIDRDEEDRWGSSFISWGEFYLPDSGWVPFCPMKMRGSGIPTRHVRDVWPWFGTLRNLNQRIPLSYTFHPPVSVISHGFPAVYGWDPRPNPPSLTLNQFIAITSASRGRGQEDPK